MRNDLWETARKFAVVVWVPGTHMRRDNEKSQILQTTLDEEEQEDRRDKQ